MRVLISAYTGLGNFILKTPIIRKFKDLYPESSIEIITGNSYGAEFVLQDSELISCVHILKIDETLAKKISFFWELRKTRYDAILLPFDAMPKFLLLGSLFQRGKKFVHVNYNLNNTINQKIKNLISVIGLPNFRFIPLLPGRHEIDLNYDLLERFLEHPFDREYQTLVTVSDDDSVLKRFKLEKNHYIVFQPVAANGALTAKNWAPDSFIKLTRKLNENYPNIKVVFIGDDGDLRSVERTKLVDMKSVVNTMGKTTINDMKVLLANAKVVVAHDSGIMHVANALQVKLVALYGPTDYTRTRPIGKNSKILFSRNECFAKMYNFKAGERELASLYPDYRCMSGLKVETVMKQLIDVLES